MARKKKVIENVAFTGIAHKGQTLGRSPAGEVIFAEGVVPGDVADILILRKRKGVKMGVVKEMKSLSEHRVAPQCAHFGVCGGCKWQHFDYAEQVRQKELEVKNAITRLGGFSEDVMKPIVAADPIYQYRNKLEYTFSNKRWITEEEVRSGEEIQQRNAVGFHRPGAFDKVVEVDQCHLQGEPTNEIRNGLHNFAQEKGYSYFDIREQHGLLRNLVIRTSSTGEVMVIVVFFEDDQEARDGILDYLQTHFAITSLYYIINQKKNDSLFDQTPILAAGKAFLIEKLHHVQFEIGPKSFFQTNTSQAERLYALTKEAAQLTGTESVYDLYTGLGSIACYVADQASQVVGIEEVAAAIDDAHRNMKLNGYDHLSFYAGDVKELLTESLIQKHGVPDVVITDPPRAGMHADVVNALLKLSARRIVYVSCNPATQARDLKILSEKYTLESVQPVDMFPHTSHIESIACLTLK